jgi:hypothetical protein
MNQSVCRSFRGVNNVSFNLNNLRPTKDFKIETFYVAIALTRTPQDNTASEFKHKTVKAYKCHEEAPSILKLNVKWRWLASCSDHFSSGGRSSGTHSIRRFVDPGVSLNAMMSTKRLASAQNWTAVCQHQFRQRLKNEAKIHSYKLTNKKRARIKLERNKWDSYCSNQMT